jgi:phosphate transport system permease protein
MDWMAWSSVVLIFVILAGILGNILWHGATVVDWQFLTAVPEKSGRAGGIAPMIVSTLMIVGISLIVSVPIGVGTALLLSEFTNRQTHFGILVRRSLDVLAGVPSIVFGLFGNAFFCKTLGLGFSIASGGLTLACMVLPILIRSTEEGLRAVPGEYRRSGAALGFTQAATFWHLILPAATPGIVVGLVLGVGRAFAETAALIFTSGYVDRMPESILDSGRALSIHIYDLSMNVSGGDRNAYGASVVLISLLILINGLTAGWASRWMRRRIVVA